MINYFVKFLAFLLFSFVLIKVPKKHESLGADLLQQKYTNKSINELYCQDSVINYTTYYNTTIPEFNISQQVPIITMNLNQNTTQVFIFPTDQYDQMTLGAFIGASNSFFCGKNQANNVGFIFGPNTTQIINDLNKSQIKQINIMHSNNGQQYLFKGKQEKIENIIIQHYHTMDIYIPLKIQSYTQVQYGFNQYQALLDNATYSITQQMKQIINNKESISQKILQSKTTNFVFLYLSIVIFLLNINIIHPNAKSLFWKSIIPATLIRIFNFVFTYILSILINICFQVIKRQPIQIYSQPSDDIIKYIGLLFGFVSYFSGKYESIHMTKHRATFFMIVQYGISIIQQNQSFIQLYRYMIILQLTSIYVLDILIKHKIVCREYSSNLIYSLINLGWQLALILFQMKKLIITEKLQIFRLFFIISVLLDNLISQFGPIIARVQGKFLVVGGLLFTSILCLNGCYSNIQEQRLIYNAQYQNHVINPTENGNYIDHDTYGFIIQNQDGCKIYSYQLSHKIDCYDGDQFLESENKDLQVLGNQYKRFTFLNKKFSLLGELRDDNRKHEEVLINNQKYEKIPLVLQENYFSRYIIDWYNLISTDDNK